MMSGMEKVTHMWPIHHTQKVWGKVEEQIKLNDFSLDLCDGQNPKFGLLIGNTDVSLNADSIKTIISCIGGFGFVTIIIPKLRKDNICWFLFFSE
jgi:hypothetical protein